MGVLSFCRRGFRPKPKTGVLMAYPSLPATNRTEQVVQAHVVGAMAMRGDCPYVVEAYAMLNRSPVSEARNACAEYFMRETSHEYLMFLDADMGHPANWYDLLGKGDIVSGLTLTWDPTRAPADRLMFNQYVVNDAGQTETAMPPGGTDPYHVDDVGAACVVIRRAVFEALGPRPFKEATVHGEGREDILFCRAAKAAGFKVTVVPTVLFEHFKTVGLFCVLETIRAIAAQSFQQGYKAAQAEHPRVVPAEKEAS